MNPETLKQFAQKYGLKKDHFHVDKRGFIIINRQGVETVQAVLNIQADYEPFLPWSDPDKGRFVMRCDASMMTTHGVRKVTTFGEVTPGNNKNGYPIAMSEKRALSRAVLKLAGMYGEGVYAADEMDGDVEQ
jgi:hypothetical protein